MDHPLNLTSTVLYSRPWPLLLLSAWLALSAELSGQVVDEEQGEAVRFSAKLAGQEKTPELVEVSRRIVQMTNQFRQENGLGQVEANAKLSEAAQYFAEYMAKNNRYSHTADGKRPWERAKNHGYDYCLVSENIAYQYNSSGFETQELAEVLVEGWKQSPEHRKNMLDPAVTETGVAVAQSPDTGYYYAVHMFGRPKSQSIEFEIENRSASAIEYQMSGRTYSLPPSYTRTHQQCRPTEIAFRWPESAKRKAETVQANDGDRFIIADEAGAMTLKKE